MQLCINGASTMPYSLEEDIAAAGAAGFEAVEIWSRKLQQYLEHHSPADLRGLLNQAGLRVAAICPYTLQCFGDWQRGLNGLTAALWTAAEIGSPALLVCPDAPGPAEAGPDALRQAGERARVYAEVAAKAAVRLAIEPLGGHPFIPGPTEAMALIRAAGSPDSLGLMMDTFHYYKSGVSQAEIAAVPIDRFVILHVNDCPANPRNELRDADRLYPGEGILPLRETLGYFLREGFAGAASVEVFRPAYWELPIDEINRRALSALQASLRAAAD